MKPHAEVFMVNKSKGSCASYCDSKSQISALADEIFLLVVFLPGPTNTTLRFLLTTFSPPALFGHCILTCVVWREACWTYLSSLRMTSLSHVVYCYSTLVLLISFLFLFFKFFMTFKNALYKNWENVSSLLRFVKNCFICE